MRLVRQQLLSCTLLHQQPNGADSPPLIFATEQSEWDVSETTRALELMFSDSTFLPQLNQITSQHWRRAVLGRRFGPRL